MDTIRYVEGDGRRMLLFPNSPEPREESGHRLIEISSGRGPILDWCVDCGEKFERDDKWAKSFPCDTERPICESCRQHPASIWDRGFMVCAPCKNGGRYR